MSVGANPDNGLASVPQAVSELPDDDVRAAGEMDIAACFHPGAGAVHSGIPTARPKVGRCRLTVSKPVLKANRLWFRRLT